MKHSIYIGIFAVFICFPALSNLLGNLNIQRFDESPAVFPKVQNASSFFKESKPIEKYLSKDFFGRKSLLNLLFRFRYTIHENPNRQLLRGKEDWVFLNRANILRHARGEKEYNHDFWNRYLKDAETYFSSEGADFYLVIAPNKHRIYPEMLPSLVSEDFKFDGFPENLEQIVADISSINLHQVLNDKKTDISEPIYYPTGSHWNAYGGYFAAQHIISVIGEKHPNTTPLNLSHEKIKRVTYWDNFLFPKAAGTKIIQDDQLPNWVCPIRSDTLLHEINNNNYSRNTHLVKTESAGPRLLLIGDSFSAYNKAFYSCSFSEILFMHNNNGQLKKEVIEAYQPDVVVFEIAERFFDTKFKNIFANSKNPRN